MVDLLRRYEEEYGKQNTNPQQDILRGYSFLTRFVIRLSGGAIQDQEQAQRVLLFAAALIFLFAILILWFGSGPDVPVSPPAET